MLPHYHDELSLGAQTAYAELVEQTRALELQTLSGLKGAFHRRLIRGHAYVYFGWRDIDGRLRMAYVGPDDARVNALVQQFDAVKAPRKLAPQAQAAIALGLAATQPKHFRIVQQLSSYGFFRAGGVLVGTHAFIAIGNMLGVRWGAGQRTLDVDFAHAGNNVSIALPADLRLSVHDALTSLEMGLLPIQQLSGQAGAQYRNPSDPELRVDFVTPLTRTSELVQLGELGLALEPLRFMEFVLEATTQAVLAARSGSCLVNIPDPARYAVHKLIVHGERPVSERVKSIKDLEQAAALAHWHLENGMAEQFRLAWADALSRGPGWQRRALTGQRALLARHSGLDTVGLWQPA